MESLAPLRLPDCHHYAVVGQVSSHIVAWPPNAVVPFRHQQMSCKQQSRLSLNFFLSQDGKGPEACSCKKQSNNYKTICDIECGNTNGVQSVDK